MRDFFRFWGICARRAARDCCAFANDWQWLFGVPALAGVLYVVSGIRTDKAAVSIPLDTVWGALLAALCAFAITWVVGFFVRLANAPVQLNREQLAKIQDLSEKVAQPAASPDLRLEFENAMYGGSSQQFSLSDAPVIFALSIMNAGMMPSVVKDWAAFARYDNQELRGEILHFQGTLTLHQASGSPALAMGATESIFNKTAAPIPPGGMEQGILLILFRGVGSNFVREKHPAFVIKYRDVLLREREAIWQSPKSDDDDADDVIRHLPRIAMKVEPKAGQK